MVEIGRAAKGGSPADTDDPFATSGVGVTIVKSSRSERRVGGGDSQPNQSLNAPAFPDDVSTTPRPWTTKIQRLHKHQWIRKVNNQIQD